LTVGYCFSQNLFKITNIWMFHCKTFMHITLCQNLLSAFQNFVPLCLNVRILWRESLEPTTIDTWFNSSDTISVPSVW
jgi:hypothetical protein